MTNEQAIEILKYEMQTKEYNLKAPSAEYLSQTAKDMFYNDIQALKMAIDALEKAVNE